MDWIQLTHLEVDCIVGIFDQERRLPQPLEVEVHLGLDLDPAAAGDLSQSIDYARIRDQLTFLISHGRWHLLESLAAAACRALLAPPTPQEGRAAVQEAVLILRKPEVLGGHGIPGIRVRRSATWASPQVREVAPGVRLEVLQEDGHTGAYRVILTPGARWRCPDGTPIHVLAGTPEARDRVLQPGEALTAGCVHGVGEEASVLLAVSRPPLS